MQTTITVNKNNKKPKETLAEIKGRKTELKKFLASGGNIADFNPKKTSLA